VGWTNASATEFCTSYLYDDPALDGCKNLEGVDFDFMIGSCMNDIQVSSHGQGRVGQHPCINLPTDRLK